MALGKHKLSSFDTDATINLIDWLKSLFERKEVVSKKEIDDITTKLDIIKDCILAKTNITDNSIITSGNSGETTSISQRTPPQDYNQLVSTLN